MCLSNVTKTRRPNSMMRVGYKIFVKKYYAPSYEYDLCNPYYDDEKKHYVGKVYSVPKELTGQIVYSYGGSTWDGNRVTHKNVYDIGFHIHSDKDGALEAANNIAGDNMRVCKVVAWDIRAYGSQNKKKCFVARHYRIMEEIK